MVNEKGEIETVRDTERHQRWMIEHRRLATELVAAPDASADARQKTLEYLIRQYGVNVAEGRAADALENVKMMARYIDDLRQYPPSGILLSSYRLYAKALVSVDPAAHLAFLREIPRRHPANSNLDRAIREFAVGQLRLLEGQATPVWNLLATIDPSFTHASALQGKVVLIALVPERWAEYAALLRDVHAKFRGPDFEIIQLSSGGPSFKEFEALEDPGEPPWRLVRDRGNLATTFYATLGLNTTPSWLIVARDGKFVIDATTRTLTKVLKRELALK